MYDLLFRVCPLSSIVPCRVWYLPESLFGCAIFVASWVELWCGLKPITVYVGPRPWPELCYRSMSNVCNQSWNICLEVPRYSLFVAVSTGPGCVWEKLGSFKISFLKFWAGGRSIKVQGFLRLVSTCQLLCFFLRLPVLLSESYEERLQSGPKLIMPHWPFQAWDGSSSVGLGDWVGRTVLVCPILGGSVVRHSCGPYSRAILFIFY